MKTDVTREMMIAHLLLNGFEPVWDHVATEYAVANRQTNRAWKLVKIAKACYAAEGWGNYNDPMYVAVVAWHDIDERLIELAFERTLENDDGQPNS